jgi:hypothetical protein
MSGDRTQDTPEATLGTAMAELDDGNDLFEADVLVIGGGTADRSPPTRRRRPIPR